MWPEYRRYTGGHCPAGLSAWVCTRIGDTASSPIKRASSELIVCPAVFGICKKTILHSSTVILLVSQIYKVRLKRLNIFHRMNTTNELLQVLRIKVVKLPRGEPPPFASQHRGYVHW